MSDADIAMRASLDVSGAASGFQSLNGHLNDFGLKTNAASASLGPMGTLLGTLANPMTAVALAAGAVGSALIGSAQAAAAWETSMTGVAKTTGLAGPELAALSQDLLTMSTNVPLAASELAGIAAAGGSLGIASSELAGFTEVAAQMGVGFEMAADQAATAGAKILNAFGQEMNTENLRSLGSVVNTMGDSFAATEPQVLDFLNRASFLNTTMGQTIPQVAALGTTLISAGLEAEVAATGVKSMLNMLTSETSKTGGMDNWAKLMGTSVDELKSKVAGDLNGTLIETANKIAAIEDPVERFQAAVAAAGTEGAPALLKLAGQQENYQKALGMTNAEWEKASSLQKTFDAQSSTVNSQWTMFTNTLSLAATELGTGMLPALGDAIGFMTDLAKIGIKVGETINDSVVKPLADLWASSPTSDDPSGLEMAWSAAKDWAGIGDEHAEQVAKEISENEKLQKSGAEALQAGVDAGVLKDPAKNAGKQVAEEFGKEFEAEFKIKMADQQIAKILARSGNINLTSNKGNTAGTATTTLENGLEVEVAYQGNDKGIYSRLFIDGQQIGDGVYGANREEVLSTLLSKWKYDQANILDLTGRTGEAAVLRAEQKVEFQFDYTGISAIFGDQFVSRLANEGGRIAATASENVQDAYQSLLDALKEPTWDNLDEVLSQMDSLIAEHELDPSEAALWAENYKQILLSGITDMKAFAKTQGEGLGQQIVDSIADYVISEDDRRLYESMIPMLETIQKESPEAFAEAGLDSILAFAKMAADGATTEELVAYYKGMGLQAGEGFKDALTGAMLGTGETKTLAEILAGDLSEIVDVGLFKENTLQPALKKSFDEIYSASKSGYGNDLALAKNWISEKEKVMNDHADFFESWQLRLRDYYLNGTLGEVGSDAAIRAFMDIWDQVQNAAEEATEKVKNETVGYNNLKAAIEDCSECAVSDFEQWQEAQDNLFQDSYIGQGGQAYIDWKTAQNDAIAATQEAMAATGGTVLGQDYSASLKVGADVSEAETAKQTLIDSITNANPVMAMQMETTTAYNEINRLLTYIIGSNPVMTVQVSVSAYADEIYAMVSAAIANALS